MKLVDSKWRANPERYQELALAAKNAGLTVQEVLDQSTRLWLELRAQKRHSELAAGIAGAALYARDMVAEALDEEDPVLRRKMKTLARQLQRMINAAERGKTARDVANLIGPSLETSVDPVLAYVASILDSSRQLDPTEAALADYIRRFHAAQEKSSRFAP